ncbi:hypothetical protein PPH41_44865, partial [Burkholderia gladioli]|nr:hypothetical protein [Burkholderia gladioli]
MTHLEVASPALDALDASHSRHRAAATLAEVTGYSTAGGPISGRPMPCTIAGAGAASAPTAGIPT